MRTKPFLGNAGEDATDDGGTLTENQLIAELGRLFYIEDVSKKDLADKFSLSRFKIARMLAKGRDLGIIRIQIDEPTRNLPEYSDPLRASLGLPLVRVIDSAGSASQVRDSVGAMTAQLMRQALEPGDLVGLGWSRTMLAVAEHLSDLPRVTVVQLSGVIPSSAPRSAVEHLREQVEAAGGDVHGISASLFAGSGERRDKWISQMRHVRELYERLDLAIVPIEAWNPPHGDPHNIFPPPVRRQIDAEAPVAETLGHWFTAEGGVVASDVTRMCVTAETQHLSAAAHVIAVAAGVEKARAILGVARSGLITGLVTDRATAERLIHIAAME